MLLKIYVYKNECIINNIANILYFLLDTSLLFILPQYKYYCFLVKLRIKLNKRFF